MKVVVTGANGKTGSIVVRKLLEKKEKFELVAVVRSESAKKELLSQGVPFQSIKKCETYGVDALAGIFKGCEKLIILTSSKPKLVFTSLFWVILGKFMGKSSKPKFYFPKDQYPKDIDWLGQKAQIDAAVRAKIKHVILVGSMGGTKPDHFLNTMGDGKILLWKRKSEKYLLDQGVPYTIIHPGGLLPHPGPSREDCSGGKRELLIGVDDTLMDGEHRTIPREDVAEVCVQTLTLKQSENTSFDLSSKAVGIGEIFTSLELLLKTLPKTNCNYDSPELPSE